MTDNGLVDILVVEDDEMQRASIVEALRGAIRGVHVASVPDGVAALDFLFARGRWQDRDGTDTPKLILLDLGLPGKEGSLSVLGQIRSIEPQEALTVAPVVIFTDSYDPGDIKESYRCGANSYIIKPLSFPDFKKVIETVGKYWMTHNKTQV